MVVGWCLVIDSMILWQTFVRIWLTDVEEMLWLEMPGMLREHYKTVEISLKHQL